MKQNIYWTLLLIIFTTHISSAKENIKYEMYLNGAAEYQLLYPKGILYPQGESGNHMGQVFKSANMDAILYTFGRGNPNDLLIDYLYYEALNPDDKNERVFTYKRMGDNWFVVSGFHKNKIFYMKSFISNNGLIKTIRFRYDKSKAKLYNKITTKIAKSFK